MIRGERMTLDQLRYFSAVCQYDSVTLAAQALNISQPSVSSAIKSLEEEFGVILFDRTRKRLVLTAAGRRLAQMSRPFLAEADGLKAAMQTLGKKQQVRLGIPPMIGSLVLQKLYGGFLPQHPQLQLQVVEDDSGGLRRLLAEGQIDMAVLPHTTPFEKSLEFIKLAQLQNVCCVSRNHPLASCGRILLQQLESEPLVLFKNSFFQTERILTEFQKSGCEPNVILYTAQLATVQNMIETNTAVGFMFQFLAKRWQTIVGIPLEPAMTTQVSLVRQRERQKSEGERALIRFLEGLSFEESSL